MINCFHEQVEHKGKHKQLLAGGIHIRTEVICPQSPQSHACPVVDMKGVDFFLINL
jgi:hypothetical protein